MLVTVGLLVLIVTLLVTCADCMFLLFSVDDKNLGTYGSFITVTHALPGHTPSKIILLKRLKTPVC